MTERLLKCLVPASGTIVDAMRSLEESVAQIALIVDTENRLIGTVTDGDIRRALLGGSRLESPISAQMNRRFYAVQSTARRGEILENMKARQISQVPVLDAGGRVVGLHLMHEMLGVVERPNLAVIMAGGRGARLAPLTNSIPKPMLPVAGRPILERLVLHLVGCGIRKIFLSVGYLAEMIEDHFERGHEFGCHIEYLRESEPLGTAGSLSLLPKDFTEPLLVMNGDLVTQADVGGLLDFHDEGEHSMTVAVRRYYHTVPFGCVEVAANTDVLRSIAEKPTIERLVNAGIYVIDPSLVDLVSAEVPMSIPELAEQAMASGATVRVRELESEWIDVGRPEELKRARGEH